jgi:hypothetical protein
VPSKVFFQNFNSKGMTRLIQYIIAISNRNVQNWNYDTWHHITLQFPITCIIFSLAEILEWLCAELNKTEIQQIKDH